MSPSHEPTAERVRARRELHQLAQLVVVAAPCPDDLARTLRSLHPRATSTLSPREVEAIASLVCPQRG